MPSLGHDWRPERMDVRRSPDSPLAGAGGKCTSNATVSAGCGVRVVKTPAAFPERLVPTNVNRTHTLSAPILKILADQLGRPMPYDPAVKPRGDPS